MSRCNSVFITFHEYIVFKSSSSIWSLKSSICIQILKTDSARQTFYWEHVIKLFRLDFIWFCWNLIFSVQIKCYHLQTRFNQTLLNGWKTCFSPEIRFISGKNFVLGRILCPCLVLALHVLEQREKTVSFTPLNKNTCW